MGIEIDKNRIKFTFSLKKFFYWLLLSLLSLTAAFSVFLWFPKNSVSQWIIALLIYAGITGVIVFCVRWLLLRFVPSRLKTYSNYWKTGIISAYLLAGIWLSLNLFITIPPAPHNSFANPYLIKLAYRGSIGIALGLVLLLLGLWLGTTFPRSGKVSQEKSLLKSAAKYIIPIIFVWTIYLLAFFPAMMSADSMDQWGQVLSGRFIDHHPAFHTFLIWLLTRISLTPTVVAIAQILALAIVAGLWFAFFETLGIRRWVIALGAIIFALTPVNGTMVNTLWKDIPYSTAVLGLSLIIARVVVTKGAWIRSVSAQITLGITTALVLLLRHDGLALGVGTLLILVVVYPKNWKSWLAPWLICGLLYFGIRGPVYKWVGVEKPTSYDSSSLSLYSLMEFTAQGSNTDRVVSSILLTSPSWNCKIWSEITPEMLKSDVNPSIPPMSVFGNLLDRIPNLLSYYIRCARSMEWVVWDPSGEVRNASHVEVLVDKNPFGISADSKIPPLQTWVAKWVYKTSHDTNLNWFIWRPAFFMYLHLLLVSVLIIRNRDLRFGLLTIPILIQSISFSLILAEPNFRYHYAVYLVSLISLPLFFSPQSADKSSAMVDEN